MSVARAAHFSKSAMATAGQNLHVFLFPLMAQGHMIPMIDMARLFSERGLVATIITTPHNASRFETTIDRARNSGHQIRLLQLRFPCTEAGLPEGCENIDALPSWEMTEKFFNAIEMLQDPFEELVRERRPSFIVSDTFLPWTLDVASKFLVPRLSFHTTSSFALCCLHSMQRYKPHQKLASDWEPFQVQDLPDKIELTKAQVPNLDYTIKIAKLFEQTQEADRKSFGVLLNSFYELEPAYVDYYRNVIGFMAFPIGPVSLFNKQPADKADRGKLATIDQNKCLKWLDSNKPGSVLYVCFGSLCSFTASQILEIAMSLEASKHPFVWVIRSREHEEWLPEKFEEMIGERGLIIRGWAPQVLIVTHPATGGFMTHCGWNSTLEGVSAGVPLITWPLSAEQFYNEKLIVEVLRIGIGVGVKAGFRRRNEDKDAVLVKREEIEKAVDRLMGGGEEAQRLWKRAREYGEMAKRAMKEGGSSHLNMSRLIQDLLRYHRRQEEEEEEEEDTGNPAYGEE